MAQSRGAMLPARALAPQPGERVLDLCAAPGGKSTHLAALMEGRGEVVAVERNRRRAAELQRTVERTACAGSAYAWCSATRRVHCEGEAPFDRVLVDPPCSGLGTLQARADLRWRVTPGGCGAAGADAGGDPRGGRRSGPSGGRAGLLYVHDLPDRERAPDRSPSWNPTPTSPSMTWALSCRLYAGPVVLTLPHRDRTAGFFIARLRRR